MTGEVSLEGIYLRTVRPGHRRAEDGPREKERA